MKDLEDIIDFANMVFNLKGEGINFEELLPKAYSQDRAERLEHHITEENGKIRALIDLYPLELRQTDSLVKAAYVGTVSVHPNSRRKGYMTELMRRAEDSARASGCDLLLLDGNRQRYQHYGFERAGIKYNYNVTRASVRHCCQKLYGNNFGSEPIYRFEPLDGQTPCSSAITDKLYALYSRRHVTARSKEDFLPCLQSWGSTVYIVYSKAPETPYAPDSRAYGSPSDKQETALENLECGETIEGYINISYDERSIFEFELNDLSKLAEIICEFADELGSDELGITVGGDETEKISALDKMSDYFNVGMSRQIKILNYKNVLEFLFKWKSKYCRLSAGSYTINIKEKNENYQICIDGAQKIQVTPTCAAPDISFEDSKELIYLLTTPSYYQEYQKPQSILKTAPANWFPLPFFLPEADAF